MLGNLVSGWVSQRNAERMGGRPAVTPSGKVVVAGTGISTTTCDRVAQTLLDPPAAGAMVAVCNVHSVMSARRDPGLRAALAGADLATPDGMPLVWALRAMGMPGQERVDGRHIFDATIRAGLERGTRHFLYGSTPETLGAISGNLRRQYPGIKIAGTHSPPFRPLTAGEVDADLARIRDSGAQVVWVGLGMPKQELWMHEMHPQLPGVSMAGIGAVFDWVAGNATEAPDWMQRVGLEWLYRLSQDPRRLWRRYIWNNPAYLVLLGVQVGRRRIGRRLRADE